jgi:hypothetical protein
MKCTQCKWDYPEDILGPVLVGDTIVGPMCGICALDLSNVVHGEQHGVRMYFIGKKAERCRQLALRYRARGHGDPNKVTLVRDIKKDSKRR